MPNGATKTTIVDGYINQDEYSYVEYNSVNDIISNPNHTNLFQESSYAASYDDGTQSSTSSSDGTFHAQFGSNPNGNVHGSTRGSATSTDTFLVDDVLVASYDSSTSGTSSYNDNHSVFVGKYDLIDGVSGDEQQSNYVAVENGQGFNAVSHDRLSGENTVTHFNTHADDLLI